MDPIIIWSLWRCRLVEFQAIGRFLMGRGGSKGMQSTSIRTDRQWNVNQQDWHINLNQPTSTYVQWTLKAQQQIHNVSSSNTLQTQSGQGLSALRP